MRHCINIIVVAVGLVLSLPTYGQVAILDKAHEFIVKKELQKAYNALSIAEKHETTKNEARTYYLKAFLYKEWLINANLTGKDSLRERALQNIKHGMQLDQKNVLMDRFRQLNTFVVASYFNEGTDRFNAQDFASALKLFKKYLAFPVEHNSYWYDARYFSGVSYYQLQKPDSAIIFFEGLVKENYDQPLLYIDLSDALASVDKKDAALTVITHGLSLYPDMLELQIAQLNLLSQLQKYNDLELKITEFLSRYPDNIEVLLMAGTVYEKLKTGEKSAEYIAKAEQAYKSVLAIQPDHLDANYNLGVLYYNEAVGIINKQDYDIDISDLTKILEKSSQLFNTALPYLLTIYPAHKDNQSLLKALQAIYYNLNMKPELEEVNRLIQKG